MTHEETVQRFEKVISDLSFEHGRSPTPREVLSPDDLDDVETEIIDALAEAYRREGEKHKQHAQEFKRYKRERRGIRVVK